jgi:outer membrane protein OmpA-like peptidoglycan-associated protein
MKSLALLALLFAAPAAAEPAPEPTQSGLLAELEFGEGSARLPVASVAQLGLVAAWVNDAYDRLVVIDGHADARGGSAGNVLLSRRRARLVRDQLLALGVDPSQIIISAFGAESRPRARVALWGAEREITTVAARRSPVQQR